MGRGKKVMALEWSTKERIVVQCVSVLGWGRRAVGVGHKPEASAGTKTLR